MAERKVLDHPRKNDRVAKGAEPPDNGDMETSERLTKIETRMETFEKIFATKEDLHRELGAQTWRIIGAMLTFGTAMVTVTYFIAKNIH